MQKKNCLTLDRSYAYCDRVARTEAQNFYPAFRVLPAAKRQATCALYAFLRKADDLSDGPGAVAEKRAALADWRVQCARALEGEYRHPLHPALHHAMDLFHIPKEYLWDALDGVEMDLSVTSYPTFADLYAYCYRVASVVGLACIHIWGFHGDRAKGLAVKAGIAFQLTNILRDLSEDAGRGRVYLPEEDLRRFDYGLQDLARRVYDQRFRTLMKFETERARHHYLAAQPLSGLLEPAGRAVFQVMSQTYRGLLDAIEKRNYDVFSGRVTLSRWRKLSLVIQALPVRLGWA
jgi:phytoene synthase